MTVPEVVDYRGFTADGDARMSSTTTRTPAEVAEWLYGRGWQQAVVRIRGEIVGAVTVDASGRWWWGYTADSHLARGPK